ncbi:MAG TPA: ATPase domain-containing protein [Nitrososphaerales archaeon]|nr:ATPase domain-containing protein [Nitrososphaerales archaeon]
MVSTGLEQLDNVLGGGGYPEKSSILIAGPPGVGKEALGYWFMRSGLLAGDFCLYVTRLEVSEVLEDVKGFRIPMDKLPVWMASSGAKLRCDINDLVSVSSTIKETLRQNTSGRARVVTDILSSLLMLNSTDTIYRFFGQLLSESKQRNAVFVATIEEGMHQQQTLAAMEQLFDGVLELRLYEEGSRVEPLFRVRKMRGVEPRPGYFRYEFLQGKMEISAYVK